MSPLAARQERALTDREVAEALRAGFTVDDTVFDAVYPAHARGALSDVHWTPVRVARRAARLLTGGRACRVLDVGAGVGKLCIVGALVTRATFVGIEHRRHLVDDANRAARRLRATSAHVRYGQLADVRWEAFDAFYFFNPFAENVMPAEDTVDRTVVHSPERLLEDVSLVEAALARARIGTRLVTYHGYGGRIPRGYVLRLRVPAHTGFLRLWVKVEEGGGELGDYELEAGGLLTPDRDSGM
jgi:SAM-dependent methyltransferase